MPVDTLDRGTRGCARPSPAISFDPAGGYVHVVYFLDAPEGPGVFFAHSMDRGATLHSPVAIAGQPSSCGGVGPAKVRSNQARVAGEKQASGSTDLG